ncbi:hypothetical protein [Streptomyces sp. NPDC048521]|uniref:hypothetical protein n=1 Tax=Streptomyces sp. NPDC048521 TaxID=3365566 RepID=UPI0037129BB0
MTDQTTGSGDERYPTGRFPRTPDDEWVPGDPAPGHRAPREARPEERLPGEPTRGGNRLDENTGRTPGEGSGGRIPGATGAAAGSRSGGHHLPHGSEGLAPGTEDLGAETPGTRGTGDEAQVSERRRMPDDGLGAASTGDVAGREAGTTESRAADTWPTAPGSPAASGGTTAPGGAPGAGGETAAPAYSGTGGATAAPAPSGTGGEAAPGSSSGAAAPLLAHDETDRWEERMRQVVAGFVDEPLGAVEEADRTLEEIAARFSEAVTRRRRTLRRSWEGTEERGPGSDTDTEQLRLALRDYRELAGRLLHS